jgi:hypothetical protein
MDPWDSWFYDCLHTGVLSAAGPIKGDWNTEAVTYALADVLDCLTEAYVGAKERYMGQKASKRVLVQRLTTRLGGMPKIGRMAVPDTHFHLPVDSLGRAYTIDLPKLDYCRTKFEEQLGDGVDWEG